MARRRESRIEKSEAFFTIKIPASVLREVLIRTTNVEDFVVNAIKFYIEFSNPLARVNEILNQIDEVFKLEQKIFQILQSFSSTSMEFVSRIPYKSWRVIIMRLKYLRAKLLVEAIKNLREFLQQAGINSPEYAKIVKDIENALSSAEIPDELDKYANVINDLHEKYCGCGSSGCEFMKWLINVFRIGKDMIAMLDGDSFLNALIDTLMKKFNFDYDTAYKIAKIIQHELMT